MGTNSNIKVNPDKLRGRLKISLIVNDYAGHKTGRKAAGKITALLREKQHDVDVFYTAGPGDGSRLAAVACLAGTDLVVAVGGDGTVNEVARALTGTGKTMGIVPVGSGNGLARELGIPKNLLKCVRVLVSGQDQAIDVFRVNKQPFFCTSGIGFNARIADRMSRETKRGFLTYIRLVISESLSYRPFHVRLSVGGKATEQQAFMVTFANARQFGNNAFIAPAASMTDELVEIVIIGAFHKFWLPLAGLALFFKFIHRLPFVKCFSARSCLLESAGDSSFHFDGEPGELDLPAEIALTTGKLIVRRPF